jgi:hypothetical protein
MWWRSLGKKVASRGLVRPPGVHALNARTRTVVDPVAVLLKSLPMKHRLVLGGAAIALVGVVVYLVAFRDADRSADSDDRAAAAVVRGDGAAAPDRDVPARTPRQARAAARDSGSGDRGYTEDVTDDGVRVRDHRAKTDTPHLRPFVKHPTKMAITVEVTDAVMKVVRPLALRCFSAIPDSAFADDSQLMIRVELSIDEAGNVTTPDLAPRTAGIDHPDVEAAVACIRDGAPTIQTHVDHPAVASEVIAIPLRPLIYRRTR